MPEIDLSGLAALRAAFKASPQARAASALAQTAAPRIDIIGPICPFWGISAAWVAEQLNSITAGEIRLRIHSDGGDVLEGVAIHNLLAAHPARIVAEIIGHAASAASWVAMAADEILIWQGGRMMIHNSWQEFHFQANADDIEATVIPLINDARTLLRQIDADMRAAYARRTGIPDAEVGAMMAATTWMTAEEAVAKGFADKLLNIGATASTEPVNANALAGRGQTSAATERPATQARTVTPEVLAGLRALAASMTAGR
jgi:ATP-dependent Clp protease, protease subunit